MQPYLSDARRALHEARGEWPHPNLTTLLARRAQATPERVLFVAGDRRFTAVDVLRSADRLAAGLRGLGIGAGDVVSWQLPNWIEAVFLAFALDRIGAISNPILPILREREVSFICRQVHARALIVPGFLRGFDHRELAAAVSDASTELAHVLVAHAEPAAGQRSLDRLLDAPLDRRLPASPIGPHDVAMIFYTSGTEADPKGVMHTPSTLGALVAAARTVRGTGGGEIGILWFPITHLGGLAFFVVQPVVDGTRAVFVEQFDPEVALDLIEREGVTSAGAPPAILQGLLRAEGFRRDRVRSVRIAGLGAADVPAPLIREVATAFDAFVYRSYGMTECPMTTAGRRGDAEEKLMTTDGRPVPGALVRVVDDAGRPAAADAEGDVAGEIELFAPQLCVGYVDPRLSAAAFTADGFLRSGDLGVVDAEGFVRIIGRKKDVIIRKGENLSAKAIEDELHAHPRIADAAVIGVPDAASGERVCACIVLRPNGGPPLTLDALRTFMLGRKVMAQKIPEQIEILDGLPRNAMGKVLKVELRRRFGRST
ncbi:MAG TPA: AMP-binding protein [Candidatus Acidoferrales bacterium]|nr:AMP-binding protein [Candidatus Acidoferrales bacterium]